MAKEKNTIEDVRKWTAELVFPGKVGDFVQDLKEYNSPDDEHYYEFCFFTDNFRYRVVAIDRKGKEGERDYLGCQVTARKRRAGESWERGNDLPDGDLTKKTWNTIVRSIVCYELVRLSQFKRPDSIPDN